MPPATRRRGASRGHIVKPDPDQGFDLMTSVIDLEDEETSHVGTRTTVPNHTRSNAPPPSERPTESEPLLREIRSRGDMATSPRTVHDSFFHTSFQDIGKKLKACNDTLGELQQLGVSHDVQLPELVLVGDQSAGKSSLMSGLANLDLPRSEGACTRCPLHIRVSRNSEWSCRVWLRKEFTYQPPDRPITQYDVTKTDPFYPWKRLQNSKILEFKTMHDKGEIEAVLRWAQIAILNDKQPHELFVPGSGATALNTPVEKAAKETLAKFSPNVVALELKGPALPDLSFYDMPGIFTNPADARDQYLVNVVQNLSAAYIQHPSAIILVSLPMNVDAENSATFGLTRGLDALDRTIGVITKADLLPDNGNSNQWVDILEGKAHSTGLGYFITSRQAGTDLDQLTQWETMMFGGSHERWPTKFLKFKHRCGVERLKAFLSERLGEEFAKSLPNIKHKIKGHLDRVVRQLAALPELPHNVELEIQTCLNNFADNSRVRIDEFAARINDVPANFRNCLLEIKPKFTLRDHTDVLVLELSDDDSDAGSMAQFGGATPTSKRRSINFGATPSAKRTRFEQVPGYVASPSSAIKPEDTGSGSGSGLRQSPASQPPSSILVEPFVQFGHLGKGFRTIRGVHEEIQAKMKAGMPNIIPPEVYNDLAMEAIRPWSGPTEAFLKHIVERLQSELEAALDQSLQNLKKRFIYTEAKRHLRACLKEHLSVTRTALEELYGDETERLMTFNEGALKQCIKDEEDTLFRFRHQMRMQGAGFLVKPLPPWESLTEEKQTVDLKRRQSEEARLKPDQFIREVKVVAYVRGYYRLAALRYADAASQRIICRMIPAIRRQLRNYLDTKLGVQGPDAMRVYERLMDEDAATAQKREMLKSEKEKFELALASIETLELGTSASVPSEPDVEGSFVEVPRGVGTQRRGSDATMVNGDAGCEA